jgi:hypothetical protein
MTPTIQQLSDWLRAFVEGDRSKALAGRIEVALDRLFPEDERFVDLVDALASYEPGGGDLLFSYERVLPLCRAALKALDGEPASSSGEDPNRE